MAGVTPTQQIQAVGASETISALTAIIAADTAVKASKVSIVDLRIARGLGLSLIHISSYPSTVVRDGIVVDFMGASRAVRNMKAKLEDLMGVEFYEAATAVPPGIISGNVKVISNVVESVGLDVINVVDEPTAAASVLGITNGAVVDVGGGTTGISILKDGEVIFTADEPTGGTHMTLVLAGSLGCSFEEAERIKKDPKQEMLVFPVRCV